MVFYKVAYQIKKPCIPSFMRMQFNEDAFKKPPMNLLLFQYDFTIRQLVLTIFFKLAFFITKLA